MFLLLYFAVLFVTIFYAIFYLRLNDSLRYSCHFFRYQNGFFGKITIAVNHQLFPRKSQIWFPPGIAKKIDMAIA